MRKVKNVRTKERRKCEKQRMEHNVVYKYHFENRYNVVGTNDNQHKSTLVALLDGRSDRENRADDFAAEIGWKFVFSHLLSFP